MGEQIDSEVSQDEMPMVLPADAPHSAHADAYGNGGMATRYPDGTTHFTYDPAVAEVRTRLTGPLLGGTELATIE